MKYQEKRFPIDKYIDFWKICKDFNLECGDITPTQTIEFERLIKEFIKQNATDKLKAQHEAIRNILIDYNCVEYGDCIIDEICEVVGLQPTTIYSEE